MNRSLFIILVFQHIHVVLLAVFQFCFDNNNELHLFLLTTSSLTLNIHLTYPCSRFSIVLVCIGDSFIMICILLHISVILKDT